MDNHKDENNEVLSDGAGGEWLEYMEIVTFGFLMLVNL